MKKKIPRRRIDVNVAELDRIIDGAKSTPLSESDSQETQNRIACAGREASATVQDGEDQFRIQ